MIVDGSPVQAGDWLTSWVNVGSRTTISGRFDESDLIRFQVVKVNRVTLDVRRDGEPKRVRFDCLTAPHRITAAEAADW